MARVFRFGRAYLLAEAFDEEPFTILACPVKNSTYRRRSNTVTAWKKSAARMVLACPARKARQVCPDRMGAGFDAAVFEDLPHG